MPIVIESKGKRMDHRRKTPSAFWRSWTTREAIMARTVRPWAPTRRRMNTCCWALLLFLSENRPEVRMIAVMTTPGNNQRNLEQAEQGLFLKLAYATWDKRQK